MGPEQTLSAGPQISLSSDNDGHRYNHYQEEVELRWEALCRRCGACCGILEGDPCEHLVVSTDGKTCCREYERRFGFHHTINGRELVCVPIRQILHKSWPGDHNCSYKKYLKK